MDGQTDRLGRLQYHPGYCGVCLQVVILVGDGSSVDPGQTLAIADWLKSNGAEIYGIANGVGSAGLSELSQIASSPYSQYVLQLGDNIPTVSQTLLDRLCNP